MKQIIQNRYNAIFVTLLLFHTVVLLYLTSEFSISYKEALIYFGDKNSILSILTNLSTSIFGQNDYALRLPFLLFYIGSVIILYLATKDYFKTEIQRLSSVAIFMLLPGINSAALLVNEAIVVVFFTLLYLYIYKIYRWHCYLLLVLFLFIDNSFAILFLGLFFYSLKTKDNILLVLSLMLFGISMSYFGFDIGGKPKGYLLDTFAVYGSIFSPILFLYFFYSIYRIGIKQEKAIEWYISTTALVLSLVFSLRQQIKIDDFAPFVVIAIPLMVKLFSHSLNIRLKQFRKFHYIMLQITVGILILSFFSLVFNKYLYLFLEKPKQHFAYKYNVAKELSKELKKLNIYSLNTSDDELALRLKFYGIKKSDEYYLTQSLYSKPYKTIDIKYINKSIKQYYIYR